jgi:hypothetical protein
MDLSVGVPPPQLLSAKAENKQRVTQVTLLIESSLRLKHLAQANERL